MSEKERKRRKVVRVLIYVCAGITVVAVVVTIIVGQLPASTP